MIIFPTPPLPPTPSTLERMRLGYPAERGLTLYLMVKACVSVHGAYAGTG